MSNLPSTYKACVYDEPGKISTKVVDLDMPEPGAGEVLINLSVYLDKLCALILELTSMNAVLIQESAILIWAS
jgi:hypothetical protein